MSLPATSAFLLFTLVFPLLTERNFTIYTTYAALEKYNANVGVIYYGRTGSKSHIVFTQLLGTTVLPQEIPFFHITSESIDLPKSDPNLFIYRKINGGEELVFEGTFNFEQIQNWLHENLVDKLPELTENSITEIMKSPRPGFIVLDFLQFSLIKAKTLLKQFCEDHELKCGKVSVNNENLGLVVSLMKVENEPGVSKLGYWNPRNRRVEIYRHQLHQLKREELYELYNRGVATQHRVYATRNQEM